MRSRRSFKVCSGVCSSSLHIARLKCYLRYTAKGRCIAISLQTNLPKKMVEYKTEVILKNSETTELNRLQKCQKAIHKTRLNYQFTNAF